MNDQIINYIRGKGDRDPLIVGVATYIPRPDGAALPVLLAVAVGFSPPLHRGGGG